MTLRAELDIVGSGCICLCNIDDHDAFVPFMLFAKGKGCHVMGCWGVGPYENDGAVDWFGHLWDEFPVPKKVEETLKLDIQGFHEEIRAAAYVLLQLGKTYCRPVGDIDKHCELAATRLEELLGSDLYRDEGFRTQIMREIAALRFRISKREKE